MIFGFNENKSLVDISNLVRSTDIEDVVREDDIADVVREDDINGVVRKSDINRDSVFNYSEITVPANSNKWVSLPLALAERTRCVIGVVGLSLGDPDEQTEIDEYPGIIITQYIVVPKDHYDQGTESIDIDLYNLTNSPISITQGDLTIMYIYL